MPKELFMDTLRAWREQNPNPEALYISVIPKMVADSMALEGDIVDIGFLEKNLALV
jgi:hypothetical protein